MTVGTMSPNQLLTLFVDPTLKFLERRCAIKVSDEARVMVMAIAGQESNWQYRLQQGGPARSFWQFEKGGGVHGVLTHAASKDKIKTVCGALLISCDETTVYEAMAWSDLLAASMARLLLFTDPAALPALGAEQEAWELYLRVWRPGMPHPENWPRVYGMALDMVTGATDAEQDPPPETNDGCRCTRSPVREEAGYPGQGSQGVQPS